MDETNQELAAVFVRQGCTTEELSELHYRGIVRAQELCERRGGRPALPVPRPKSPYGLCGLKATLP